MTMQLALPRPHPEHLSRSIVAIADALLGPRGCLLTFHRAAPTAIWGTLPNRNFYLDLGFLDRLLGYLKRTGWAVVTIEEAVQRAACADLGGRYVNFSIDDGYRDTFELVAPLFRRHNVPITVFVSTGIPDGTVPMWWAGLEDVISNESRIITEAGVVEVGTPEAKRRAYSRISEEWDRDNPEKRYAAFCALNRVDVQEVQRNHAISWDMLEALRHDPLVEIGAHTVNHAHISSLSPAAALSEITESRQRLEQRLGVPVRHFAFPYGRSGDCGPRDFALARKAGFASAATTRKGLVRRNQDPFCLPRNTLHGGRGNLAHTELHLTGLTGLAARMLRRV
jgi:peptidoglycan/xylan/chitin deacetylase (PgdA/CDA1 family)